MLTSPVARSEGAVSFSHIHVATHAKWSPDGALLASAVSGARVVVRSSAAAAAALPIVRVFSCPAALSLEWSPDSLFLLALAPQPQAKRAVAVAFPGAGAVRCGVSSEAWSCVVDEGAAGILWARWAPDSRHVVACTDFAVRLTVWSLVCGAAVASVPLPKPVLPPSPEPAPTVAFSADGAFMAVATRRQCHDAVLLVSCASWQTVSELSPSTDDLVALSFSSCSCGDAEDFASAFIAAVGSASERKVSVLSFDGSEAALQTSSSSAFVRCAEWSPRGKLLAVGCSDETVLVGDAANGSILQSLPHPHSTMALPENTVVFVEDSSSGHAKYVVSENAMAFIAPKATESTGVTVLRWSPTASFLATFNKATPCVLWVWSISGSSAEEETAELVSVLAHEAPVRDFAWAPSAGELLAVCTGNDCLQLWTPAGCSCISVPHEANAAFHVRRLQWLPSQHSRQVLLLDKDAFCCCSF